MVIYLSLHVKYNNFSIIVLIFRSWWYIETIQLSISLSKISDNSIFFIKSANFHYFYYNVFIISIYSFLYDLCHFDFLKLINAF